MKLLVELLNLQADMLLFEGLDVELFEELGTLNVINKKLLSVFKEHPSYNYGARDEKKKALPVRGKLGSESRIETTSDKNQNEAFDKLVPEQGKQAAVGIIMEYDGAQIMAVVADGDGSYQRSEKPSYSFIFDAKFFSMIMHEKEFEETLGVKASIPYKHEEFMASKTIVGSTSTTISKIKQIIKLVFDAAKKNQKIVKTLAIYPDVARAEKSATRAKGRVGMLPLPTGNKIAIGPNKYTTFENQAGGFFKNLKIDLNTRLETFKASKAKSFDTPEDLMKALITDGYFDKLKFMGFTYKLYNDHINFESLKITAAGKKSWIHSESYIEYKIQSGTPEYKKAVEDVDKLRDEFSAQHRAAKEGSKEDQDVVSKAYYAAKKKILPPEDLKIILRLKGGVITPVNVQVGEQDVWTF